MESTKNITQCVVGYVPVQVGMSVSTVDDTENLSVNPVFLETTLGQHLWIPLSIFDADAWGHMRTLCLTTGHRGRNKTIFSRYCSLYTVGRFISILAPRDP